MSEPKARGTWGKRVELTEAELEVECGKFFGALVVPKEWKHKGYDRIRDLPPTPSEGGGEGETVCTPSVLSVGAIYYDTRTKGFGITHYRVFLNIYSLMGGIVVKTLDGRRDKPEIKTCVLMNKTVEAVNEFIYNEYHRLEREHKYWKLPRRIWRKRLNY